MKQYSARMVIIHWLTLALLVAAWFLGESVNEARHEGGATLAGYMFHSIVGGAVLLLALARLYFRRKDGTPPSGNAPMDKVAKGVHYGIYVLLVLLSISGVMQVVTSKVCDALKAWDATLLPSKFTGVPAHEVHEVLVTVLIVLAVVHILGAAKHQFIVKDGLMERMSLRRKG